MSYRLGVDVGGTFTDVLLLDEATGACHRVKTPSTPQDQSVGVLEGIRQVCRNAGIEPSEVREILHGTTVATNAILEGKGAKVGLVTTQGFRQVLQIARSYVPGGLAGWIIWPKPEPLAALENTVEVSERIDAVGSVVRELNEAEVRERLNHLRANGVEALSISLINSYTNGVNEKTIGEIAAEILPDIPVSLSSDVLPELREYERTLTTVANAYVQPQVARYVDNLERQLSDSGLDARVFILRSDGGLIPAAAAARNPVSLLLSGPAGGVTGATWFAEQAGFSDFLTFDMGGTSTDVALVQGLQPRVGRETSVGDLNVRATSVDVRTVGAGGGSIAHVPALTGALRVGPQSAGASPGPAAYGHGGEEPTVTDANVVLGYLPSDLAGGAVHLDRERAGKAVATIAESAGLDSVEKAAAGIIDIVNENMFGALRLVSIQQGFDPRDFALVAFGGAGPLHANALGRLTGSWPVIVPPSPGVLCAYGDATTGARGEAVQTSIRTFDDLTNDELCAQLESLAEEARTPLLDEGLSSESIAIAYSADLRYHGQGFEIPVTVDARTLESGDALSHLAQAFDAEHQRLFDFLLEAPHELVTLRATSTGPRPQVTVAPLADGTGDPEGAVVDRREVWIEGDTRQATIYDRSRLRTGDVVVGPAIVTEMDSTTLVLPQHAATVHRSGSLLIRPIHQSDDPSGQE